MEAASYTSFGSIFRPALVASMMKGNPYQSAETSITNKIRLGFLSQPIRFANGILKQYCLTARASQPLNGAKIFSQSRAAIASGIAHGRMKIACHALRVREL